MQDELATREIRDIVTIRGVEVPADVKFRQIIVTGPPASGKSSIVSRLGGWPEEGYLDIASEWWRDRMLAMRPREVHLGFPVLGRRDSLAVSDPQWIETNPELDLSRVNIPPAKRGFFSVDWLSRFVFDVQLPRADVLHEIRRSRARAGTHPRDAAATLQQADSALGAYRSVAHHLSLRGVRVYVRLAFGGRPREFTGTGEQESLANADSGSTG